MTYIDAIQAIQDYQDELFGTRLLAVSRAVCDDGSEECMVMYSDRWGRVDRWYVHECGYKQWMVAVDLSIVTAPQRDWQLLQVSPEFDMFAAVFPGKEAHIHTCIYHKDIMGDENDWI
jgi:hypothetical protein